MTLEDILAEWNKDSVIKNSQLDSASLLVSKLHSKYIQLLFGARAALNEKKAELKLLRFMKGQWYMGKLSRVQIDELGWSHDPFAGGAKPLKSNVPNWVDADGDVIDVTEAVTLHQEKVDALSEILGSIRWRHQNIKNAIDYMKFVAGT